VCTGDDDEDESQSLPLLKKGKEREREPKSFHSLDPVGYNISKVGRCRPDAGVKWILRLPFLSRASPSKDFLLVVFYGFD
jgi:hypothetical protein